MKKLKLISKKYVNEPIDVYDIEVENEHHYFLENGLLSHNSMSMFTAKEISGGGGVKYNASIIFVLGKGKLKDAEGDKKAAEKNIDAVKVGVTIYVTPVKQRFARPIKVQFHIPFYKPINPYVGLESFVNWKSCGVVRGKLHTEKAYEKLEKSEKKNCIEWMMKDSELDPETLHYVEVRPTATTLVCKHLGGEIPLGELFTEKVFTEKLLKELDENVIKPTFQLPDIHSLEDLAELTKELELDNEGNTEEENKD